LNLILNTSCEFHYDDVTVMSFMKIVYDDIAVTLLLVFCG